MKSMKYVIVKCLSTNVEVRHYGSILFLSLYKYMVQCGVMLSHRLPFTKIKI